MFYVKNLPVWERALRIGLGAAFVAYLFTFGGTGPWIWALASVIAILVVTGLIGFCPACALVGRRAAKGNVPIES